MEQPPHNMDASELESDLGSRSVSFEYLITELRPAILAKLSGEETRAARPEDVGEALVQLMAFARAVEIMVSLAKNGDGSRLPGDDSVRVYVEQLLNGEAPESSKNRMTDYFRRAIGLMASQIQSVDDAIEDYSERLAEGLKPERIQGRTKVGPFWRLLGLSDVAFWRRFKLEYGHLSAQGLREIAEKQERR